jgi:hypothetical protein
MTYQGIQRDPGYMGDPRRGASLGRADLRGDTETRARFYVRKMALDSGGYDAGGAYWGHGGELFHFESEDGEASGTVRIYPNDRSAAFEARGGDRIGEPGHDDFARRFPRWHAIGGREAAKDSIRETYANARFFR